MTTAGNSDRLVRDRLLAAVAAREPVVSASSPPGAGKTSLVVAAVRAAARDGRRVAVITNTNNQGAEVVGRLAADGPGVPVAFTLGASAPLPESVARREEAGAVTVHRSLNTIPDGPGVVVGCAAKWLHHPHVDTPPFDLLAVEEAAQLPRHMLVLLGNLATRHLLVGDEGQIPPFSRIRQERWAGDPMGPLVPALGTLPRLAPDRAAFELPVSHRLPQDTVDVVRPALYPRLRFEGGVNALERRLEGGAGSQGPLWPIAESGSLVLAELPRHGPTSHVDLDAETSDAAADLAASLLAGTLVHEPDAPPTQLEADDLAVVCSRRDQVGAVRNRLRRLLGVGRVPRVDTANRLQGLTFQVVVAVHPLAGANGPSAFTLEPGRLSVMLSRHRICCVLIGREGMADELAEHVPESPRVLGEVPDAEHVGWRAHALALDLLADRTVRLGRR